MDDAKLSQQTFAQFESVDCNSPVPAGGWLVGEHYQFEKSDQELIEQVFRRKYRRPLFVLGSGVSVSCGVPGMKQCFHYLANLLNNIPQSTRQEEQEDEIIRTMKALAAATIEKTVYRPAAAKLLGELQSSKIARLNKVWDTFCRGFLSGEVTRTNSGDAVSRPLGDLEPSDAHKAICWLYDRFDALCVSFNYDGLTYKALQKYLNTEYPHDKKRAFILDDPKAIREFFGRNPSACGHSAVFKIRGDIFYAVCRTSGCPSNGSRASVYRFPGATKKQNAESWADEVLKCPECEMARSLGISFPGLEEKERDTENVLNELWRYVVPGLSAIFIVGLSGVWDELAIHSLLRIAQISKIPVFDVKPPPTSTADEDNQFITRLQERLFPDIDFRRIETEADSFMRGLALTLSQTDFSQPAGSGQYKKYVYLDTDKLWTNETREFSLNISTEVAAKSFTVSVPAQSKFLTYHIAHTDDVQGLQRYSQLGLKNYWWGDKDFGRHNRYLHSIGTARIAGCWHRRLRDCLPKTARQKQIDPERENQFLMTGALLHDFGHLPFSHLFEDIFRELHWSADPARRSYSHIVVGREKIDELLEHTVDGTSFREKLKELGYSPDDLANLIEGRTGSPYLDAIINSPIDADKIDYIFRDSDKLKLGVRLMPRDVWLREFLEDQDLSPEGFVRLNKRSALRLLELLETRLTLYSDFYFSPWMRAMEEIAATIVVEFCLRYTTMAMFDALRSGRLEAPHPDWGRTKIALTASEIEQVYAKVIEEHGGEQERTLEKPLLDKLLTSLIDGDDGPRMDKRRKEYFRRLKDLLGRFDDSAKDESGTALRRLYQQLHLAGPFKIAKSKETEVKEIVRYLRLTFPDGIIVAVAKSPKILATAEAREYKDVKAVGENVLVPSRNPSGWTMHTDACFPLHLCDFTSFEKDYLTVVLLDPWCGERISGRYIRDVFLRNCKAVGIEPKEVA